VFNHAVIPHKTLEEVFFMSDQGPVTAPKGPASSTPEGITPEAPEKGTSPTAPEVPEGTAKTKDADQPKGPAKSEDTDVFFDPKDLPPELLPYHKQLQAAFTKKTQGLKKQKEKIEAYDAFMQDIPGNLQRAAQQYGFRMVPQGNSPQAGVEESEPFAPDWQPQSYPELYTAFEQKMMGKIMQNLGPVFQNVKNLATTNAERQLADIDPDWKIYEDEMTENLKKHPTLAHDISALYRMSVPEEVFKSRAVQDALKKMETKAKSAKIQGKGSMAPTSPAKAGKPSFQQAVDEAKADLASKGLTP
jgi:hypothetical protein